MPRSPSMYVIALRHEAVLRNAGSYEITPWSSAATWIWPRSRARIAAPSIGMRYSRPVLESRTSRASGGSPEAVVDVPAEDDWPAELVSVIALGPTPVRGRWRSTERGVG